MSSTSTRKDQEKRPKGSRHAIDRLAVVARIQQLLDRLGVSSQEMDRRAGLTAGHTWTVMRRLEEKDRADVGAATLLAIAQAGGVSVDWLLTGRGEVERLRAAPGWPEAVAALGRQPTDPEIEDAGALVMPFRVRLVEPLFLRLLLASLALVEREDPDPFAEQAAKIVREAIASVDAPPAGSLRKWIDEAVARRLDAILPGKKR